MQTFKEFYLQEARRNPEINPKISIYQALEPYKDRDDMYITYTSDVGTKFSTQSYGKEKRKRDGKNIAGDKVGINPKSSFNTPNGIYTYPLKLAWKFYANKQQQKLDVPFAGENLTVHLLQAKPSADLRIMDVSDYSSKDFDRDYQKLADIIIEHQKKKGMSEVYGWEYAKGLLNSAMADSKNRSPGGQFWNMTRCTFFLLNNVAMNETHKGRYKNYVEEMMNKESTGENKKRTVNRNDEVVRMRIMPKDTDSKSSNKWTKIFLDLGYGAITDKQGKGIIHQAEPTQAVFFTPKAYKVLGAFMNKSYQKTFNKIKLPSEIIFTSSKYDLANELISELSITSFDLINGISSIFAYTPASGLSSNKPLHVSIRLDVLITNIMNKWKTKTANIPLTQNNHKATLIEIVKRIEDSNKFHSKNTNTQIPHLNFYRQNYLMLSISPDLLTFYKIVGIDIEKYDLLTKDMVDYSKYQEALWWIENDDE